MIANGTKLNITGPSIFTDAHPYIALSFIGIDGLDLKAGTIMQYSSDNVSVTFFDPTDSNAKIAGILLKDTTTGTDNSEVWLGVHGIARLEAIKIHDNTAITEQYIQQLREINIYID